MKMSKKENYNHTMYACFTAYIVQGIVNNFAPLLFVMLQAEYGISLEKIGALIMVNFGTQLAIDFASVFFVDHIGYRKSIIIAHVCSALGFVGLTVLPDLSDDPFIGLLISVVVYAIGGGLLEVLVSPVVEACPNENKEKAMSLLHSFYCWGQVGVVFLSTLFFSMAGIRHWKIITLIWVIVPVVNGIVFFRVPIRTFQENGEKVMGGRELTKQKMFWLFMLLVMCVGACEHSVGQWASTFAEQGLGVSKSIGDLAGPMSFSAAMGLARVFYGKKGGQIRLEKFMALSGVMCILSYLMIAAVPSPAVSLLGCALCGLSVGIMWLGAFSMAAKIKGAGTAMFALFALAGDLGCSIGPGVVGFVAENYQNNLHMGIGAALIFPIALVTVIIIVTHSQRKNRMTVQL